MLKDIEAATKALNDGKNVYFVPWNPLSDDNTEFEEMLYAIDPKMVANKYFDNLDEAKDYAEDVSPVMDYATFRIVR